MIQRKLLLRDRNRVHVCGPICLSTHLPNSVVLVSSVAGIHTTEPLPGAENVLSEGFREDHYSGCFVFSLLGKGLLTQKIYCSVQEELLCVVRH